MRFYTILAIEDHEPFRRLIRLILAQRADFQIVGEASDGVEGLQKAEQLRPDLILLDLGLPKLNGMEVARRLRTLVPEGRILILSQESSPDIVHESFASGAVGYVDKLHAQSDLLPAIEAALAGKRFVGRGLTAPEFDGGTDAQPGFRHEVQFYSDDSIFLDSATRFIAAALRTGSAAIVLATKPHQDSLLQGLYARGVDVESAIRQGLYVPLDAADTLSTFMVNDWPEPGRFFESFTNLVRAASKAMKVQGSRVAIFGEGVALLWAEGKTEAAIRLEQLGRVLAETHKVDILCAYPFGLRIQEDKHAFSRICAEHSAVHYD